MFWICSVALQSAFSGQLKIDPTILTNETNTDPTSVTQNRLSTIDPKRHIMITEHCNSSPVSSNYVIMVLSYSKARVRNTYISMLTQFKFFFALDCIYSVNTNIKAMCHKNKLFLSHKKTPKSPIPPENESQS